MTVKTLSTVAVRIIGWLVILEGIRSMLSSSTLWMIRLMFTVITDSTRPNTTMTYLPIVSAVIIGAVEISVGFALISSSEFFGKILCKGIIEERA